MASLFLPSTVNTTTGFKPPFERKIIIASLPSSRQADISHLVTQASVSYDIGFASKLEFEVLDPNLDMSLRNYFILGRDVIYETQTLGSINSYTGEIRLVNQLFEIADVKVSQGPGGSAIYTVECYTKAIQQMKRDKKPGAIRGSGTAYVREAARLYGLGFYGQETSKGKKLTKASGSKQAQSVWDVLDGLASDAKFVLFEVNGILVFASEKFLLHKWGTDFKLVEQKTKTGKPKKVARRFIPLQFPNSGSDYVGTPGYFTLTERPTIHKSANDPYGADGSCVVERINGTQIRPGMTAYVGNIPNMSGYYLIESVSYKEMEPDPVSVTFRTITKEDESKIKLLPLNRKERYQQTQDISFPNGKPRTAIQAARDATGIAIVKPRTDARIIGENMATEQERYNYPIMPYANLTRTYASYMQDMLGGKISKDTNSTGDYNSLIITGNIDLWERPVLPMMNPSGTRIIGYQTLFSTTHIVQAGSEYRGILLPRIYTEDGEAVLKDEDEVIQRYEDDGGYSGTAKHLGVLSGATRQKAILNARDYATLLSIQQTFIYKKRFGSITAITNTPGSADSNW